MVTLDPELQALKANLLEMFELTKEQLEQCLAAIETADEKATKKVIKREKRINSLDINIDRDCENILALHSPVATDLRFVLSTLKISSSLERIGDNSKSLAKYIRSNIKRDNLEILDQFNVRRMLEVTISMMEDMGKAIEQEEVELAKKIADMDDELNESTKKAFKISRRLLKEDASSAGLIFKNLHHYSKT